MNKSRFIEQLNLYLDNELSAEEAESFLADLKSDPEKRRIFSEYTQIHRACAGLKPKVRTRQARGGYRSAFIATGGIAAAFSLMVLGGLRMVDFLAGSEDGLNTLATDAAVFEVDPAQRIDTANLDGIDLASVENDLEDWRRGLILAGQSSEDAFAQQAALNSGSRGGGSSGWDSAFTTGRNGMRESAVGVVRASTTGSSIYNPVYLRTYGNVDRSR